MTHGTPDWGQTAGVVTTYQLTDLGELAVRLGSIVTHDRRGDVAWMDGFEHGLGKWEGSLGGTGSAIGLSTEYARNGQYSALLTAGSDGLHQVQLAHSQSLAVLSCLGVEVSFQLGLVIDSLSLYLDITAPPSIYHFGLRWVDVSNLLQILDSDNDWVTIASGLNLRPNETLFHTMKMVGDPSNERYLRVILNDVEYPLTAYPAQVHASAAVSRVRHTIILVGRDGQNDQAYIDDFIYTRNEPA